MTILEAGKDVVIPSGSGLIHVYRIGFINKDDASDETELDAINLSDLEELWRSLCPEFNCDEDSVEYIELVGIRALETDEDTLTDEEFSAIATWTHSVKLDEVLDVVSNKRFIDYDGNKHISVKEGMQEIADAMAYHPKHDLCDNDAEIMVNLLLKYKVMTEKQIKNLPLD